MTVSVITHIVHEVRPKTVLLSKTVEQLTSHCYSLQLKIATRQIYSNGFYLGRDRSIAIFNKNAFQSRSTTRFVIEIQTTYN